MVEQLRFGGIDLARVSLASLAEHSLSASRASTPGAYESERRLFEALDGDAGRRIADELALERLIVLAWLSPGPLCVINSKLDASSSADLRGLKIGVPRTKVMIDALAALGITAVPIRGVEAQRWLDNGYIDGYFDTFVSCCTQEIMDSAPYALVFELQPGPEVVVASKVTYMRLEKEERRIIESAAQETATAQRVSIASKVDECFARLAAAGVPAASAKVAWPRSSDRQR